MLLSSYSCSAIQAHASLLWSKYVIVLFQGSTPSFDIENTKSSHVTLDVKKRSAVPFHKASWVDKNKWIFYFFRLEISYMGRQRTESEKSLSEIAHLPVFRNTQVRLRKAKIVAERSSRSFIIRKSMPLTNSMASNYYSRFVWTVYLCNISWIISE